MVQCCPSLVVHKEVINQNDVNYLTFSVLKVHIILMLTTPDNCGILFGLVFAYL